MRLKSTRAASVLVLLLWTPVPASDVQEGADCPPVADTLAVNPHGLINLDSFDLQNFPALRLEEILAYQVGIDYRSNWRDGTGLSVRGGDPDETAVLIDGIFLGNRLTNVPFLKLNRSALQSASIRKGGFDAEFGDLRAGLVQLVTRNGPRDRYSLNIDFALSQPGKKHFGPHAYDRNGAIWETFAGERAFERIDADEVNNPASLDRFGREWWTDFGGWDAKALDYATNQSTYDDDRTPRRPSISGNGGTAPSPTATSPII